MIGHFFCFFIDELFYSLCARFAELFQFTAIGTTNRVLFGKRSLVTSFELPHHISNFMEAMPPTIKFTVDEIINNCTLLPFYSPFLSMKRNQEIIESILSGNGSDNYTRSGLMASSVKRIEKLKFCPTCVSKDRSIYKEAYWHRVHQVVGVLVCPEHQEILVESPVLVVNRRNRHQYVTLEKIINQVELIHEDSNLPIIFFKIAEDVSWLLNQPVCSYSLEDVQLRYKFILQKMGLQNHTGQIKISELNIKFKQTYDENILALLQCKLDDDIEENWLMRLLRNGETAHYPLRHILFIRFLGYSVQDFLSLLPEQEPFTAPFPCLNPVCPKFNICIRRSKAHSKTGVSRTP
jgi:hypothetical protein